MNTYSSSTVPGTKTPTQEVLLRLLPSLCFCGYVLLAIAALFYHEPWGDEIHSWNIAKGSASYLDLIQNSRYEGHPPAWYTIL
ncbi:hypothetical protein [Paraflavitalea speifideaquila]|uniref:hypothetical protein n=1 Tax=Paraflavitalea speifideaquila TaxID=3076558 RepID=UPI0028EDEF99|nr:hypothetical protein [Paraflavitalea speifideiaquila]